MKTGVIIFAAFIFFGLIIFVGYPEYEAYDRTNNIHEYEINGFQTAVGYLDWHKEEGLWWITSPETGTIWYVSPEDKLEVITKRSK